MSIFLAGGASKPVKATSNELDARKSVSVYHPGYSPPKPMMILVAFEAPSGQCGVPFSVVLDACRILANNKDGTLLFYRPATTRTARYAVCASFRAWTPPNVLPAHWDLAAMGAIATHPDSSATTYSAVVKGADGRCAVTGDFSRLETSHLVPEAEEPWWILRRMTALTNNPGGINSPTELPCPARRPQRGRVWTKATSFSPRTRARRSACASRKQWLISQVEYHLRAVSMPRRIHPMNVYVRFAWGLFRALQIVLRELSRNRSVVTVEEPNLALMLHPPSSANAPRATTTTKDPCYPTTTIAIRNLPKTLRSSPPLMCTLGRSAISSLPRVWTPTFMADLSVNLNVMDASFLANSQSFAAHYEQAADMYPGYSKVIRLQHEYRKRHPEVSAVRSARVARVGEDDDEQRL
ncbi:hypothetical protein B0H14DRAFT_3732030 [Mycena olivaceomarginata]|nr:hypothetical protein B0H14DRAFT_3732030 [Mycena olivaceomarginata]